MLRSRRTITSREGRIFAFTLAAGFAVLAILLAVKGHGHASIVFAVASSASVVAGAVAPRRLGTVRAAWMSIGETIGRVTTPVLLAIVYFAVVTPLGMLRQLTRRKRTPTTSYWQSRPLPDQPSRMERQF